VEAAASSIAIGPSDVPSAQQPLDDAAAAGNDNDDDGDGNDAVAQHLNPLAVGRPVDIKVKACAKDGIRNRKLGVLFAAFPVVQLHKFVCQHYKSYVVTSTGANSSAALIVNAGGRRVQMPEGVNQACAAASQAEAIACMKASGGETFSTVVLEPPAPKGPTPSAQELMAMMKCYLQLNPAEFEAEIWSMQLKPRCEAQGAEQHIVEKPQQARALRQALINLEASKAFVRFCAESSVVQFDQMQNLDKLLAITINLDEKADDPNELLHHGLPFLDALAHMETYTFVLLGDAGLGKTCLARAMAALQCAARQLPYWVESNTPDSLRQVAVNGFFREHVPVILDEWRPAHKAMNSGSETMDMLKCLTTVADGATIKCRYSDIKFAPSMPKIMTCNCSTMDEWLIEANVISIEDRNAVMRRCLFVEVKEQLMPQELRDNYKVQREKDLHELQIEVLRKQGLKVAGGASFIPVRRAINGTWERLKEIEELDELEDLVA
jgi:hypothetical protein